jgi:hypothetical protein
MSDMVKSDADPQAISSLRARLYDDTDLSAKEKATVARFLNDSAVPANPVTGRAVWQRPSNGSLIRLPGVLCAEMVAANVAAAGLVVYFAGSESPSTHLAVLALVNGIFLLQCLAVLAALWRRGKPRARRTAVAAMVAFAISFVFNFALATWGYNVRLDLVAGFGAACMAIPLMAAAFSLTRALLPPHDPRPLMGPPSAGLLRSSSGHLQ